MYVLLYKCPFNLAPVLVSWFYATKFRYLCGCLYTETHIITVQPNKQVGSLCLGLPKEINMPSICWWFRSIQCTHARNSSKDDIIVSSTQKKQFIYVQLCTVRKLCNRQDTIEVKEPWTIHNFVFFLRTWQKQINQHGHSADGRVLSWLW